MERESGTIVLYAGNDVENEVVTVPRVLGMTAAAANQTLVNAGLNVRIVGTKNHLTGLGTVVVNQSPMAGESVAAGTVITLTFQTPQDVD